MGLGERGWRCGCENATENQASRGQGAEEAHGGEGSGRAPSRQSGVERRILASLERGGRTRFRA
jgi:hypothetical protein